MSLVLDSKLLKQLEAVSPIAKSTGEHNSFKMSFKNVAVSLIGEDRYYRYTEATRKVIDYLIYLCTKKGFAYPSIKHIADKYGVSEATVKRATKLLQDTGLIAKRRRRGLKHNATGVAVYFLTNHPYYVQWKEMLNLEPEPVDNIIPAVDIEPPFLLDDLSNELPDELSEKLDTSRESKAREGKKSSNLLDLMFNKLRDLINTSNLPKNVDINRDVLTTDQMDVMEKIKQAKGIKQYWVDNAFDCAREMNKKMTAIEKIAVDYTIKEMMVKDTDVHNAGSYFKSACKSRMKRATIAFNLSYDWLNSPATGNKPVKDVPFYDWLNS